MLDKKDLKEIDNKLAPLKEDIDTLKGDVKVLKEDVGVLKKDMKVLKKDMSETRNDVKTLIAYFDRDYVGLRKRVEAIEEHLGFTPAH